MKFTCNQLILLKGLNIISKAITNRSPLPILKGILLEVKDGILKLSASNLDITIEYKIELSNYQNGKTVVPAKVFNEIIRKLPNAEIEFDITKINMEIKCLNSKFNIATMDPEQFPQTEIKDDNLIKEYINKNIIKDMIKKTAFAASTDISSGTLNGILLEFQNNNIRTVAIDGYRLAIVNHNLQNDNEAKVIILAKIMNEISKIIVEDESEEKLSIILCEKHAIMEIGCTKIITTLVDGKFADFERILPKEDALKITINRRDLLESLSRASIISNDGSSNSIKLIITDDKMEIKSKSEIGNVEEFVNCSKVGEDLEIAFNGNYLMDILKVIEDENISMKFLSKRNPCLIEPIEGEEYKYMLSPVRS